MTIGFVPQIKTMKEKIGVLGTGRIGAGEATLAIGNGFPTVVVGRSSKGVQSCREVVLQNWSELIQQGVASDTNRDAAMRLLEITEVPDALRDCTVVFEAVSESAEAKAEAYRTLGKFCLKDAVIASCTSSMQAEDLAAFVPEAERFAIAHPFQPAHLLPLVEVVRHPGTADWAVERLCALLRKLHRKIVVLNRCVPGLLVNRLAQALFREAIYLMEQGVCSAEDIDLAVKYAVGMRYASMGLLEYFDDVGFALESVIAANVYPDLCGTTEVQTTVLAGLADGAVGRAAGRGLYDWEKKDQTDFLLRKQAPYFCGVKDWDMPG